MWGIVKRCFGVFSKDIGMDLGTCNTLVYVKGEGIVLSEPSVVAVRKGTNKVLLDGKAVGATAKEMIGKTPGNIVAVRPMRNGVIADFDITEALIAYFIQKVHNRKFGIMPRIVIAVPSGITGVEKRAVINSAERAGARQVFVVEEPMAAGIGAGLPMLDPIGNMIVDIGSLYPLEQELTLEVSGRDVMAMMPRKVTITSEEIREAMKEPFDAIIHSIKETLEETPPELAADLTERGITMAGGGSLIRGIDKLLSEKTGLPVTVSDDPLSAVANGTGVFLNNIDELYRTAADF